MIKVIKNYFQNGVLTNNYPLIVSEPPSNFDGSPIINFQSYTNGNACSKLCPSGAIVFNEQNKNTEAKEITAELSIDYGKCIFCGACKSADPKNIIISNQAKKATTDKNSLIERAIYVKQKNNQWVFFSDNKNKDINIDKKLTYNQIGELTKQTVNKIFGRSLHIREVDAGSCNGCEVEINSLTNPVYDIERFGVHFVASPRHADMLLVTGPVTHNMEIALKQTYDATPNPKLVIAVGACGISGGIFGKTYASCGGVDTVIPVDVYLPGCPPRPEDFLFAILLAIQKI